MNKEKILNALAMYKREVLSADILIEVIHKENKDITFLKNGDVLVQLSEKERT